jgi:signal transduction histidine kinase
MYALSESVARWTERLLECFYQAVSHELPNHLTALLGLLHLLRMEEEQHLGPDGREYLRRLIAGAQRMRNLVHALAELSRVARAPSPAEPVPLIETAREAATEVNTLFSGRAIDYAIPESGPVLALSRLSLRQVLVQLFRNAVQAAVPECSPRIEVGARELPHEVEFWVADNGRGLPPEWQPRLFEPFALRDPAGSGNGLGLFLVRQLVEHWGGTITVRSDLGRGSVFTLTAPRASAASSPPEASGSPPEVQPGG